MIRFYSTGGEYGCFSNFSPHKITLDGLVWPTTEHYFQAQKFFGIDDGYMHRIRQALTPHEAAILGRDKGMRGNRRPDWYSVMDDVMRVAVMRKFSMHDDILEVLLSTGDKIIAEDSPVDSYWGVGSQGDGQNMLGRILMEVRDVFSVSQDVQFQAGSVHPAAAYHDSCLIRLGRLPAGLEVRP